METLTTRDITISVESFYQSTHSRPKEQKYIHAYRVLIENNGKDTVQLLRRHWYILDSMGTEREVEGEGVIGQQPILQPGQSHQYVSWCPLATDVGKMSGTFLMRNTESHATFEVRIPEFKLVAPFKNN